jgi:hypothetical protein
VIFALQELSLKKKTAKTAPSAARVNFKPCSVNLLAWIALPGRIKTKLGTVSVTMLRLGTMCQIRSRPASPRVLQDPSQLLPGLKDAPLVLMVPTPALVVKAVVVFVPLEKP